MSILFGVHRKGKSNLFYSFFLVVSFVSNNREYKWGRERRRKKERKMCWKMNSIFSETALNSFFLFNFFNHFFKKHIQNVCDVFLITTI